MKILFVNKFLYPNGGSETYIFELGKELIRMGNQVEYFGMEHEGRIVGNHAESYTADMDFHSGKLQKLLYPFRILYSTEARKKIRLVLDDFAPDVVHINNINYQITPSILYEIRKYEKQTGRNVKIIATAHDYQWVCPNHMMYIPQKEEICDRCLGGHFGECTKNSCIHSSKVKSLLGTVESLYYHGRKTYALFDTVICPSSFLKEQLKTDPVLKDKLLVMHNFVSGKQEKAAGTNEPQDISRQQGTRINNRHHTEPYVLYFGRYAKEKGIETLLLTCEKLPDIPFVFAGNGPLEELVNKARNIQNRGFLSGEALKELIQGAVCTIYPSEWYENCPFSVMESQMYGTPVIGADIGGIPELIVDGKTGLLFKSRDLDDLKDKIEMLWNNHALCEELYEGCSENSFDDVTTYCEKLLHVYEEKK